jgi:hypothetical protein
MGGSRNKMLKLDPGVRIPGVLWDHFWDPCGQNYTHKYLSYSLSSLFTQMVVGENAGILAKIKAVVIRCPSGHCVVNCMHSE